MTKIKFIRLENMFEVLPAITVFIYGDKSISIEMCWILFGIQIKLNK